MFIGIGGSAVGGNYANNSYIQSPNALVLNSGGATGASTPNFIILSSGNVGIGTTNPATKLDVNGVIRASDYSGGATAYGSIQLIAGGSVQPGYVGFFKPDGNRAGYIGYQVQINSTPYLQFFAENGYGGLNIAQDLVVNNRVSIGQTFQSATTLLTVKGGTSSYSNPLVQITQNNGWDGNYALQVSGGTSAGAYVNLSGLRINGTDYAASIYNTLPNTDISITQTAGNTTGGNINLTTVGTSTGNINLCTNGANIRFKVDPSGYNVSMTGSLSTLQTSVLPTAYGINGYWYIPIPYLNTTNNYYHLTMLNIYNGNNSSFWCGHVIINPITNQLSYTTLSNGGFFTINLALEFSTVWNIKISFSNSFPITSAHTLYYKYIG
jgi:hypothetical protein